MRFWRGRHAATAFVVVCAWAGAVAHGQPGAGSAGSGSAAEPAPTPAGSSPVESVDVPVWRASPPRFAVAPFENQSGVQVFDWLVAGAPFEIADKTEDVLGLEPAGGSLRVGPERIASEPDAVAAFAAPRFASYVITGWVDRPKWQLRLGIELWRVTGRVAVVVAETQRTGDPKAYHQLLGEALGDAWEKAGVPVDPGRRARLARPLATDTYAVTLLGRGLGHLTGALGAVNLKAAAHDLERAVFIDPKCFEAQRVLGELYLRQAADPAATDAAKLLARAVGKFNYANDLAPTDLGSMRAAATGATRAGKHEAARDLLRAYVTRKPWNLDARYEYGAALWETGDAGAAERQLAQVTHHRPDALPARRVLALIHASRGDTSKLVGELEAIASRAPADLEVKADLATAYGSIAQWPKAVAQLEAIAAARPADLPLAVRIGDARRQMQDVDGALGWYARAARLAPESSWPGFAAAQALYDAGRLPEANRAYTLLQKYRDDLPAAEQALGAIALRQARADDAAWYLRRAVRDAPRNPISWRTLVAAELARKDAAYALTALERGLAMWPRDAQLLYLAGVAHAMAGQRVEARAQLAAALAVDPRHAAARAALGALDAGGQVAMVAAPELVRPWGDARALADALDQYAFTVSAMATVRMAYQSQFLSVLAALGKGPYAPVKTPVRRSCPIDRIAPVWAEAQRQLRRYERLGHDLEGVYRFIARHHEAGATAALLPSARAKVVDALRTFRVSLADVSELRAEWTRSLIPELRYANCTDKLLAAAIADPARYRVIQDDKPPPIPVQQAARPRPRATFYVDNTRCADAVDVFIDGALLGQVAPGRRSALVSDGGERTLCLIVPGAAQCGDRGTVRQVYLHDGWATTMYCPK